MADRVCRSLLEKLPNSLQANLIMAQIRQSAGLEQEAAPYLKVALALDPEGQTAYSTLGSQSPIPPTEVKIPQLQVEAKPSAVGQEQPAASVVEDMSWLDHVGEAFESGTGSESSTPADNQAEPPDWLRDWSAGQADQTSPPVDRPASTGAPAGEPEPQPPADAVSDWMSEMQSAEETVPEVPNWLLNIQEESAAGPQDVANSATIADEQPEADQETPGWPEGIAEEEIATDMASPFDQEAEPTQAMAPVSQSEDKDLPDWLRALGAEAASEMPVDRGDGEELDAKEIETPDLDQEELPDWLRALGGQEPAVETSDVSQPSVAEAFAEPDSDGEVPDWLQALSAQEAEAALIAESETTVTSAEQEVPDWLQEMSQQVETEDDLTVLAQASSEPAPGPMAGWLSDTDAELPDLIIDEQGERVLETPPGPTPKADIPDWLQEQPEPALPAEAEEAPAAEPVAEAETLDWLSGLEGEAEPEPEVVAPAEPISEDEIPDWLQELRTEEPALPAEEEEAPAAEPVAEAETSDWLSGLEGEAEPEPEAVAPAEPISEDEIPDWLQELRTEEPALPAEEEEAPAAEPVAEAETSDWLSGLEGEAEPEAVAPAEPVSEDEIPDWLQELRPPSSIPVIEAPADVGEQETYETEVAQPAVDQPLSSQLAPALDIELPPPVEGMPSWLSELEADISGQAAILPSAPVPSAEVEAPVEPTGIEMPPPVEGMPGWLSDLESEIAGPTETIIAPELSAEALEPAIELTDAETSPALEKAEQPAPQETETRIPTLEAAPEDAPDWLTDLETDVGVTPVTPVTEPITEFESEPEFIPEPDVYADEPSDQLEVSYPEPSTVDLQSVLSEEPAPLPAEEERPEWLQDIKEESVDQVTVEEMPDWLEQVHSAEAMPGPEVVEDTVEAVEPEEEMDWLRGLQELEPSPITEPESVAVEEQTVIEATPPGVIEPETVALPEEAAEPEAAQAVLEPSLAQARGHLDAGALDEAAKAYERLAAIPALREEVIQDLEQAVTDYPDHPALLSAMGDAYKHAGELQKALRAYKAALARF
jgi:hypothetical protein